MNDKEREEILASARRLLEREKTPSLWHDNYSDLTSKEKSMLLDELFSLCKVDKELIAAERKASEEERELRAAYRKLTDELIEAVNLSNQEMKELRNRFSELLKRFQAKEVEYLSLTEELRVYRKHRR